MTDSTSHEFHKIWNEVIVNNGFYMALDDNTRLALKSICITIWETAYIKGRIDGIKTADNIMEKDNAGSGKS